MSLFTCYSVLLQFSKQMGVRTDKPEVMFRPEDVELRTSTPRIEEEDAWCAATVNDGALTEHGYKFYLQLTPDMVNHIAPFALHLRLGLLPYGWSSCSKTITYGRMCGHLSRQLHITAASLSDPSICIPAVVMLICVSLGQQLLRASQRAT